MAKWVTTSQLTKIAKVQKYAYPVQVLSKSSNVRHDVNRLFVINSPGYFDFSLMFGYLRNVEKQFLVCITLNKLQPNINS